MDRGAAGQGILRRYLSGSASKIDPKQKVSELSTSYCLGLLEVARAVSIGAQGDHHG